MESKTMTKGERDELRRIVKHRFKLLDEQVAQREAEIRQLIRDRIEAEYADAVAEVEAELAAINCEADVLERRGRKIAAAARRKGVVIGYGGGTAEPVEVSVASPSRAANVDARVNREMEALRRESGLARTNLSLRELDLLERLAIGALESDEAKEFMESIPTVDGLLPMPEPLRQLKAA
jgi:hypothetical protein